MLLTSIHRVLFTALLATTAHAQVWQGTPTVTTTPVSYNLGTFGSNTFGGSLDLRATKTRTTLGGVTQFDTETSLLGRVKINSGTFEAASLSITGHSENGGIYRLPGSSTSTASTFVLYLPGSGPNRSRVTARVAGRTIHDMPFAGTTFSRTWEEHIGRQEIVSISAQYMVGIVPVNLRASAGGGAGVRLVLSANTVQASLNSQARVNAWAIGSASAAVGVSWASAGVRATLTILESEAHASVTASLFSGISGTFTAIVRPLRVFVELFAQVFGSGPTLRLVDWSRSPSTWSGSF